MSLTYQTSKNWERAQQFEVGDTVEWKSGAGGFQTTKRGVVVYVRPDIRMNQRGRLPTRAGLAMKLVIPLARLRFDVSVGRTDGGVIVEVRPAPASCAYYYQPRTPKLQKTLK